MSKTRKKSDMLTYDTPISKLEKKYGFKSDVPPDTKVGDVLKKNGFHVAARMLKASS